MIKGEEMNEFEVGDIVRIVENYEEITRELDAFRSQGNLVGPCSFLIHENRESEFKVISVDSDGDCSIEKFGIEEWIPSSYVVHPETIYKDDLRESIFVVNSIMYGEFNSVDQGIYFKTSYEAHLYINHLISKLPPEIRDNFSKEEVYVTELKN